MPQLEFWIIPIYPSIPLDGAKVDLSTTSKQQGCTFSNKIQTSAHKTNWGIRSNAEHLCRTPHKLVLWKSSTLFSPFLAKPSLAGHHVTWNIAYSAVKSLYIMLQYFTPCYTFFLNQDSCRTLWQSILQVKVTCSSPSTTNWKKGRLLFFNLMSGNVFWWMSTEDRFVVLLGSARTFRDWTNTI